MSGDRDASSDRLTVVFLLLACTLSLVLVCGIAYFLYITFSPAPAPSSPALAGTPTPIDGMVKGSKAYMCQDFTSNVTVLDVDTGSVLDEICLPAVVSGVAASHDGHYVYIVTYNRVYLVDSRADRIVNSVTTSQHTTTGFLAVSPDDRYLYVVCSDGMEVIALDGDDGAPVAFTPGVKAVGIGISPDGRYVFTTDWSNCSLQVYNTTDRCIEETIDLVPDYYSHENLSLRGTMINAAGQAGGITVSPDGSRALVGIWYGTYISAVDLRAMAFEKAIHLYRPSNRCAVYSPDGSLVYLMCYDYGVIFILNGSSFGEIKSFGVGPWPVDIAITPDGQYLYVSYQQSDMAVYHLPEGTFVRTINNTPRWSGTHIAFVPAAG
jgi:DNA-binding beta-propeller fold protein YncE